MALTQTEKNRRQRQKWSEINHKEIRGVYVHEGAEDKAKEAARKVNKKYLKKIGLEI